MSTFQRFFLLGMFLFYFSGFAPALEFERPLPEAVQYAQIASLYSSSFWPALEQQAGFFLANFSDSAFAPQVRLKRAVASFYLGRYEQAITLLENAAGETAPEAAYWQGRALYELGRHERALQPLYEAASFYKPETSRYLFSLFYAARALIALDKPQQAIPLLEYLVTRPDIGEDFFTVSAMLFAAYENLGQNADIISFYEKTDLAAFPAALAEQIAYSCAAAFSASGEYGRALAVFEPLAASLGKNAAAAELQNDFLLRLGARSLELGDYKTARENFDRIEKSGASGAAYAPLIALYRAEINLAAEKNPQKALEVTLKGLDEPLSYQNLLLTAAAKYAVLCGKYAEALDYSRKAALLPESETAAKIPAGLPRSTLQSSALYWHLSALYGVKDYAGVGALASAAGTSTLEPDSSRVYALALAALQQYEKAIPAFENLYRKTRLAADALNLAAVYLKAGKNAEAFSLASSLSVPEAAYSAGLASFNLRNWANAEKYLSLVNGGEKLPYARYYTAYSAYRLEKFALAADLFSAFLRDFPRSPLYWNAAYTGSIAALQAGKPAQALNFAETAQKSAVTLESRVQSALVLSGIYADSGKTAQAIALLKPLSEGETPAAFQCLFALGDLYAKTGKLAEADSAWTLLLQKNPSSTLAEDATFRRAEMYYEAENWQKAAENLSAYRKDWPRGRYADAALYLTAESLFNSGNTDQAILFWQELAAAYPKTTYLYTTLLRLTAAYRSKGEYRQALAAAEQLLQKFAEQAKNDGFDRQLSELRLLAAGFDKNTAALLAAYERSGKDATADGRALAVDLAASYISTPDKRAEGIGLLKTALDKSSARLETERDTAAKAALMLGNTCREDGNFGEASRLLLLAAEYYAPLDREKTAQALYGAVESFDRTSSFAEAASTFETMKKTAPDSVWTKRAAALTGGN